MAFPNAVFLDTSVLAGQQYNFASAALSSFTPVAAKHKLTLLLPDPTEREIHRQIDERSREALAALDSARRRAPFLAKWKHFPAAVAEARANWEVRGVALKELDAFLKQFVVQKLGYDDVDVAEIMRWYDKAIPPFGNGKKRKEFPDAFAIACLAAYADKHGTYVAVVSEDPDFQLACKRYASLLHFRSLPALTELLLGDQSKVEALRSAILSAPHKLEEAIATAVAELPMVHLDADYEIDDSNISSVYIADLRVVALGSAECTVTFEAEVEVESHIIWNEWHRDEEDRTTERKWVLTSRTMSGSAKLAIDPSTLNVLEITVLSLDQEHLEIHDTPGRLW